MATLSLNTSIISSHKSDFYSGVLSGSRDEIIPNQQDYSSTGYTQVQLTCPANISGNLVVA